jgi:adenine-specific DNA methylase
MLMALLLPDPCDANCPEDFKPEARRLLAPMPNGSSTKTDTDLRKALLSFIADFANWDNAAKPAYLECARGLVKAAHGEEAPLVVDPFAGGGSIPLEALRIGCDAFASDLNPVACLILKVMLEDIPRHGTALAEELRRVGKQIKEEAEKELAEFYPNGSGGSQPIAYLWARMARCEGVGCGAEIPLMRSFWLCKKANRRRALRLVHEGDPRHPKDPINTLVSEKGTWRFEIYEPKSEAEVRGGTVTRGNATCPCCSTVLPVARVRVQLAAQRGGADVQFDEKGKRVGGTRMLAVVSLREGETGRQYRLPRQNDYEAIWKAAKKLEAAAAKKLDDELSPLPDEVLPPHNTNCFRLPNYGLKQWSSVFTVRQNLALVTLIELARTTTPRRMDVDNALKRVVALVVSRCADASSSLTGWRVGVECNRATFARQALSMVWDFCETVILTDAAGGYQNAVEWVAEVVETQSPASTSTGQCQEADACEHPLPGRSAHVWFTDPPYYNAVGYAELSDFFFVWLKRLLPGDPLLRDPFDDSNPLVHKARECVQDETYNSTEGRPKDRSFFEQAMQRAFAEGRRVLSNDGIGAVVFAHKTTEGWEALLSGMLQGGWEITASWPITTERPGRLRAQESAALAASIHLVCRPRPENAGVGGWEDILRELPNRIGDWMERLSGEGIRGADLVFSCIGPALELFSKFDKVETAEGSDVKLPEFLEKVWEVVGRTALQQILGTTEARARNGAAGALEEDARLTALFLWTLQSTNGKDRSEESEVRSQEGEDAEDEEEDGKGKAKKGYTLIYDVARRFAQPLGIHLENWEGRMIETKKGVVRLIPVLERSEQLFGTTGTEAVALALERTGGQDAQYMLFPGEQPAEAIRNVPARGRARRGRGSSKEEASALAARREATTLDRVHAAMILQAGGRAGGLRAMLEAETQRSPDFLRLANALSALYPKDSEEKRLLDAMLLALPRN